MDNFVPVYHVPLFIQVERQLYVKLCNLVESLFYCSDAKNTELYLNLGTLNLIRIYKFHFEGHMFDIFMQMWQNRERRTSGLCTWNPWDWLQNWLKVKFISLYSKNNTSYPCIEVHFSFSICSHQFVFLNAGNAPHAKRALLTTRTIPFVSIWHCEI